MSTDRHDNRLIMLFHGTTPEDAADLLENGWHPGLGWRGGNAGQCRYLYLTNLSDNALWYSEQKGCSCILEVNVPLEDLIVDPEDGTSSTVEQELSFPHGLPGCVALFRPIAASAFRMMVLLEEFPHSRRP